MPIRVFVDSDVTISSLLSKTGAAHLLMHDTRLIRFVSDVSVAELIRVANELKVSRRKLDELLKKHCETVRIKTTRKAWARRMGAYTRDTNDAHIVAGAKEARAQFLVTYNTKHFQTEKIRDELGMTVLP